MSARAAWQWGVRPGVAVVEPVGGHGGMDSYDLELCRGVHAAGVPVRLYTSDETTLRRQEAFAVEKAYRGVFGNAPAWLRAARFARGTASALWDARRHGARVAHFHLFHAGALELYNVQLARTLGFRIVLTAHDVTPFVEGLAGMRLARALYEGADHVIAQSNVARRELEARFPGLRGRVSNIPHGNYLGFVPPAPPTDQARAELGLPADAPVLLFFGQIKKVKRLDLLLEAMPAVIARHPGVRLVIAGKVWKDDFAAYQQQMEQLGIVGHCVSHIRYIPDEELARFFAAADAVVLPYERIYQSGVLVMALGYGKAVVASDIEGFSEVVRDGDTGLLFAANDAEALARRLVRALEDPAELREVGKRGKDLVVEQFDWTRLGAETARAYAAALDRHSTARGG